MTNKSNKPKAKLNNKTIGSKIPRRQTRKKTNTSTFDKEGASSNVGTKQAGRPPLSRPAKPFNTRVYLDDVKRLKALFNQWEFSEIPGQTVKAFTVPTLLRALLTTALPHIERLDPQANEEHLEETLRELFKQLDDQDS